MHAPSAKRRAIAVLLAAEVAAMAVWFASGAVAARLAGAESVAPGAVALLTSALQAGFVAGTLGSAALALPDRFDPRRVFGLSAGVASLATAALATLPPTGPLPLLLRFLTGACMAGVYPVGMRIAASWARPGPSGDAGVRSDLGLLIGLLVGALTLGSASPHALAALPGLGWRSLYAAAAALCLAAALGIQAAAPGPNLVRAARPDWRLAARAWRDRPLRLVNAGYLGHMWELYAMWAWIGPFLAVRFAQAGQPGAAAEAATFAVIAAGAVAAAAAGVAADRLGRTRVTVAAMATSAGCALIVGWLPPSVPLLLAVCLVWGAAVIADSAQFSAAIAELSPPDAVGTLLTLQTCAGFLLTTLSIQAVPWLVRAAGWPAAFSVLAIGPILGCVAMTRLRADPASLRLAGGRR